MRSDGQLRTRVMRSVAAIRDGSCAAQAVEWLAAVAAPATPPPTSRWLLLNNPAWLPTPHHAYVTEPLSSSQSVTCRYPSTLVVAPSDSSRRRSAQLATEEAADEPSRSPPGGPPPTLWSFVSCLRMQVDVPGNKRL